MKSSWSILKLRKVSGNRPPLLIKHEVATSSYSIYLSDLTYVWTEQLNAREIKRRALSSDTSIDPSEDADQMRLFLRCVDDALNQKPGTSVDLAYDEHEGRLLLKMNITLPGSLEPLQWNAVLRKEPPSVLTRELVLPLVRQQAGQNDESVSLFQQLKEKDHLIDKFIDKMQADGAYLSTIFPGTAASKSAMKSNPRQAFGKNARGLFEFDEQQWRSDLRERTAKLSSVENVVYNVFSNPQEGSETMPMLDYREWWTSLSNGGPDTKNGDTQPKSQAEESQGTKGDSQFQRQETPPELQRTIPRQTFQASNSLADPELQPKTSSAPASDNSTTDDDDDHLAASSTSKATKPSVQAHKSLQDASDQGLISRPGETASRSPEPAAAAIGPDCRSESRAERNGSRKFNDDPRHLVSKAKVGRIGGRRTIPSTSTPGPNVARDTPSGKIELEREDRPTSEPQHQKQQTPPTAALQHISKTLERTKSPSPSPEETEEERANRIREQLKRKLAAEAAVASKKKKRRF